MALGVDIISAFDGSGIKKAIEDFKKLETTGQKAQFGLSKAAIPAGIALAGLAAAGTLAVKAAIEDQQEQAKLALTLRNTTNATEETIAATEDYIASLAKNSIFTDSQMRPALEALVRTTGDVGKAQGSLQLAMDISAATGQDLVSVSSALARAHTGNFKALQQLSPMLRDNIKEGQSLDEIFKELTTTFGGSAEAMGNTTAGQMTKLKNSVGELQESFGQALLPIVEAILPLFQKLADFAANNTTAFLALAGVLGALATATLVASAATKIHSAFTKLFEIDLVKATLSVTDASGELTGFGEVLKGVGKAFAVLGIAEALFSIGNAAGGMARNIELATERTTIALGQFAYGADKTGAQVSAAFIDTARNIQNELDLSDAFKEFGRDFQFTVDGVKVNIESADKAFEKFLDQDPTLAANIIAGLKAQLAVTDPTSRAYVDLTDAVARYEGRLNQATAAQNAFNNSAGGVPGVVFKMTGALNALATANTLEGRARLASVGALEKWNQSATNLANKAGGAAKAVVTFAEKLSTYTTALKGNFDAQRANTSAINSRISAEKAVTNATDNTRKAQEKFNFVLKGFPANSKQAKDAAEKFADAQKRVRAANVSQTEAVESVIDAEKKLIKLRAITADPESVADAERGLERSKYGVEQANFAVTEAEAELAALRLDPASTPTAIRKAEISLAEAKLGVTESVNSVKEAELSLSKEINRAATAEEIADAELDLMKAKKSVVDRTEELSEATIEEGIAQSFLNQVLNGAAESTDEYQEALRELTAAKEDEEEARLNVADAMLAEAEAALTLAAAITELNKVSAISTPRVIAAGQVQLAGVSTSNPALSALNAVNTPGTTESTVNLTVNAGMGSDPDSITRGLLDLFKQYERANGFLPFTVSNANAIG